MSVRSAPARTLRTTGPAVVLAGVAASAVALATAPVLMPPGYSWVSQTTSESAAQGVQGAWLARIGFVLLGLPVILLATFRQQRWGPWATAWRWRPPWRFRWAWARDQTSRAYPYA
jgi:hypothetical protein